MSFLSWLKQEVLKLRYLSYHEPKVGQALYNKTKRIRKDVMLEN